jgi:hypothetical protein
MSLTEKLKEELIVLNNVVSVLININYQDEYPLHIYIYYSNMNGNTLDEINVLVQNYENQLRLTTRNKWCFDLDFIHC